MRAASESMPSLAASKLPLEVGAVFPLPLFQLVRGLYYSQDLGLVYEVPNCLKRIFIGKKIYNYVEIPRLF